MTELKYQRKQGKFRSAASRIRRGIAAGLVAAGLMASSGTFANESPKQKNTEIEKDRRPKPDISVGLKFGAAVDYLAKKPFGLAILEARAGLPYGTSLSASAGIAAAFDGSVQLEELTAFFGFPIHGPMFGDLYFISSRHLGLNRDYGADIGISTRYGTAIAAVEYVQDAGQVPVIAILKSPSLKGVTLSGKGGFVTNKNTWLVGLDLSYDPGGSWPQLELLTSGVVSGQGVLYIDTRFTLGWKLAGM